MGDSKAPGRSLSESTGLRLHAASVEIDRPIFALASGLNDLQKCLVALLVASRAGELTKPWKSGGSATLALLSVIQHSPVQELLCMTNKANTHTHAHTHTRTHAHTQERNHYVVVDMAYQGFATGDLDSDAAGLRQLASDGHNLLLCQSFSKNLGLYGRFQTCVV